MYKLSFNRMCKTICVIAVATCLVSCENAKSDVSVSQSTVANDSIHEVKSVSSNDSIKTSTNSDIEFRATAGEFDTVMKSLNSDSVSSLTDLGEYVYKSGSNAYTVQSLDEDSNLYIMNRVETVAYVIKDGEYGTVKRDDVDLEYNSNNNIIISVSYKGDKVQNFSIISTYSGNDGSQFRDSKNTVLNNVFKQLLGDNLFKDMDNNIAYGKVYSIHSVDDSDVLNISRDIVDTLDNNGSIVDSTYFSFNNNNNYDTLSDEQYKVWFSKCESSCDIYNKVGSDKLDRLVKSVSSKSDSSVSDDILGTYSEVKVGDYFKELESKYNTCQFSYTLKLNNFNTLVSCSDDSVIIQFGSSDKIDMLDYVNECTGTLEGVNANASEESGTANATTNNFYYYCSSADNTYNGLKDKVISLAISKKVAAMNPANSTEDTDVQ